MNKNTREWIKIVALIPLIFSISSDTASAENQDVCFMVTSSGKSISLGNLCGVTPVDTRVFRVPIKRRSGRTPVIDVTFNGGQSFEMIVDTGASKTLIT